MPNNENIEKAKRFLQEALDNVKDLKIVFCDPKTLQKNAADPLLLGENKRVAEQTETYLENALECLARFT